MVAEGDPAPFEGILVTPEKAAADAVTMENIDQRIEMAVTATAAIWRLRLAESNAKRNIERAAYQQRQQVLEDRIDEVRPSWFERPFPVAVITTLAVVGIAAGTAGLVDAVTD